MVENKNEMSEYREVLFLLSFDRKGYVLGNGFCVCDYGYGVFNCVCCYWKVRLVFWIRLVDFRLVSLI